MAEQNGTNTGKCAEEYVVKRGDSFYLIAHKLGVPLRDLLAANRDIHPARLMVGDVLCVPREEDDSPQTGGLGGSQAGGTTTQSGGTMTQSGGTTQTTQATGTTQSPARRRQRRPPARRSPAAQRPSPARRRQRRPPAPVRRHDGPGHRPVRA